MDRTVGNHSTLSPVGPKSEFTTVAWWLLFAVAAFVCVVVIALAVGAVLARRKAKVRDDDAKGLVMTFGVIIPAFIFAGTFALSIVGIAKLADPAHPAAMRVQVIGHQWWWEVRYPGSGAVTANEIHVPVGTPVEVELTTADVIHSFWVPAIMPKMDLIPGHTNDTWLTVNDAGTYRGQCAEYCGIQHAHMSFSVVAQPEADFQRWLQDQAGPAAQPTTGEAKRGYTVFTTGTCATCHTVRGTPADGDVGPDLTHLATRSMLAAETIPNTRGDLGGWIANSQQIKPGNKMPPQPLSPQDLIAVIDYLQSLK